MNAPLVNFYDLHPPLTDFKHAVLSGLTQTPKRLSPKFFYDQKGSQLFDAITELPEYYPTRAEIEILKTHGEAISALLGEECLLLELGSGSSHKIRILLEALKPAIYMPMDISREHLLDSAHTLAVEYPDLEVHATCADYSQAFHLPYCPDHLARAAFFPGSSIGNFEPKEAQVLLKRVAQVLGSNGRLVIGVDLKKDQSVLEAAYNDTAGVTAAFNLNLLTRINRELAGQFKLDQFTHDAFYNASLGRVEMHLRSTCAQSVTVADQHFDFKDNETIHTECSYKYSVAEFHALARPAGWVADEVWLDAAERFSVHCLRVAVH
jgi:dimethylhistidine N-methyltransferase